MESRTQDLILHLQTWIRTAAADRGLLIPVSGGTDSALSFWLCHQVLPGKAEAVHFGHELRGRAWFESMGPVRKILPPARAKHQELGRWTTLLSLSTDESKWLVGSRNRTEDVFGTFSLASRVATFYPVVGLWKTEVMDLCAAVGVPAAIIDSSRQADVPCGRGVKMARIGIEKIDLFLKVKEGELAPETLAGWPPSQLAYLKKTYQKGQFKRKLPLRAGRI